MPKSVVVSPKSLKSVVVSARGVVAAWAGVENCWGCTMEMSMLRVGWGWVWCWGAREQAECTCRVTRVSLSPEGPSAVWCGGTGDRVAVWQPAVVGARCGNGGWTAGVGACVLLWGRKMVGGGEAGNPAGAGVVAMGPRV